MKKALLIIISVFIAASAMHAQEEKIVTVVPGGLLKAIPLPERKTVKNLKLTGTIDARDFKTLRDIITNLEVLDLSKVKIAAYVGEEGTEAPKKAKYAANAIPQNAFYNYKNGSGKRSIKKVILPPMLAGIGDQAFYACYGLVDIDIPASVKSIGKEAFYKCQSLVSVTVNSAEPIEDLGEGVFYSVDPNTCILHIPQGSLAAYQAAKQWQDLLNIVDDVILPEVSKK